MAELKEMLSEEIVGQLNDLNTMEAGSEEKARAIADLEKVYKLHIEETKVEFDHQERVDQRVMNAENELKKMAEDSRRWKIGTALTIGGGIGAYAWKHYWLSKGFRFEETGTICSNILKQYVLPFIKIKR